jgi:hypothetical protein
VASFAERLDILDEEPDLPPLLAALQKEDSPQVLSWLLVAVHEFWYPLDWPEYLDRLCEPLLRAAQHAQL